MPEKFPRSEAENVVRLRELENLEQARLFMDDYPAPERDGLAPEECAEKVRELEAAFARFEEAHDMDMLQAIQLYTYEEATAHTAREAAKKALPAIVALKNIIDRQSGISDETKSRITNTYKRIQAAIGTLTDTGIDHSIR